MIVDDGGHEDAESFSVVVSNTRPASPAPLAQALVASPPVIQQADLIVGVSGAVTIVDNDPALFGLPRTGSDVTRLITIALAAVAAGVGRRPFSRQWTTRHHTRWS